MVVKMPFPQSSPEEIRPASRRGWLVLFGLLLFLTAIVGVVFYLTDSSSAQPSEIVFATLVPALETATPPASGNSEAPAADPRGTEGVPAQFAAALALPKQSSRATAPEAVNRIPVYHSVDFLSGYLSNLASPIIVEGKPWDYGSVDIPQLRQPRGGTTYWDYWSDQQD